MNQNTPHLVRYAATLYEKYPEIQQSRDIGFLPSAINFSNQEAIIPFLLTRIREMHPSENQVNNLDVVTVYREVTENFELPWHLDDCALVRQSVSNREKTLDAYSNMIDIIADGKYTIYCRGNKRPKYSCIVYWNTENEDFEGGLLEFADNTIIKPEMGKYVIFDSRDVHRVRPVLSGIRKNSLFKLYEK
jgi:hypothetical protein